MGFIRGELPFNLAALAQVIVLGSVSPLVEFSYPLWASLKLTQQPFCVALGLLEVLVHRQYLCLVVFGDHEVVRIHILSALDTRIQVSTKTGQLHNSL